MELTPEEQLIAEAQAIFEAEQALVTSEESMIAMLDEELAKVRKKYDAMQSKRSEILAKKREKQAALRQAELQLAQAKRAKLLADERERLDQLARAKEFELDEMTKNAKWRERALPHQLEGAKFIAAAKRVICADSMGLGKTLQAGMAIDLMQAKKVLILCPSDVQSGFLKEFSTYLPDRNIIILGQRPKAQQEVLLNAMQKMKQCVVVINYEAWVRNKKLLTQIQAVRFDTVIADEAHIIKNTGKSTSVYEGTEQIIFATNSCPHRDEQGKKCLEPKGPGDYTCPAGHEDTTRAPSVENVIMMTGTPILNRPDDIYTSLYLINPGLFHSRKYFIQDFCMMKPDANGTPRLVFQPDGQARLAHRLGNMYFRRTRETAGIVLPTQEFIVHMIEQDEQTYVKQAAALEELKRRAQLTINEQGDKMSMVHTLALITRQRQGATWPGGIKFHNPHCNEDGYQLAKDGTIWFEGCGKTKWTDTVDVGLMYQESQKLDRACELLDELEADGRRVIVFSQFRSALIEMKRRRGANAVEFHGGTSEELREEVKRNFDKTYGEEKKWDTVLAHYKTGGIGVTFTEASAMIILDEEWNPGKNQQAYDRINRIGQTRETQVHILRLEGSVDEWMADLVEQKGRTIAGFDAANEDQGTLKDKLMGILKRSLKGK